MKTDRSWRHIEDTLTPSHVAVTTLERVEAEACLKLAAEFTATAVLEGRPDDAAIGAGEVLAILEELYP